MDYDDEIPAIVMNSGSGNCQAGFSGDDAPRFCFSSVVGRALPQFLGGSFSKESAFVGDEAQTMRDYLSLTYPIQKGIVTNWDDAEKIWEFCFKDLKVDSKDQAVLMSKPVLNPSGNEEKRVECMFERFQVPAYFSQSSAVLTLLAKGRGVGLVLDIGDGVTTAVPIYGSNSPGHAVVRQDFGGRDVTNYLQKLLFKKGYSFTTSAEWEVVREIKEQAGYVSLNYSHDISGFPEPSKYVLPDGSKLAIENEKFQCAECLFQPSLVHESNDSLKGLHELIQASLENCDTDIRKDFYCNVILSGGTSMMPNLVERLDRLLQSIVPPTMVSKVVAPIDRRYSVWIGGSILSSLSTFQKAWIKKAEYEEFGPTIVHRRSF